MDIDALSLARWQFGVAWGLTEVHLARLTNEACLWLPSAQSWTVRPDKDGWWSADWTGSDPHTPAPPSIGWLSWHVIWWWSGTLAAVRGDAPQDARSVSWPGNAEETVARLRSLSQSWSHVLAELDDSKLVRPVAYPWPEPRPLLYALSWVNLELMKNAAEIGEVLNMFAHRTD